MGDTRGDKGVECDDVELEEFELFALDRIKLLKAIDDGLSTGKKGVEMKTVIDVSQNGETVFEMERKGSIGKNTMVIRDSAGNEVGEVKQTKRGPNRASFELIAGGQTVASRQTGRLRAGGGFDITDLAGEVVAWVRRLHVGVIGNIGSRYKSSPDNYALRLARPLDDPLRTLVVATPMSVDSAINQRDDGLDLKDVRRVIRRFT